MNDYLKLTHMEIRRFRHVLFGLMAITAAVQFSAVIAAITSELSRRKQPYNVEHLYGQSPLFPSGKMTFAETMFRIQTWYAAPILLCIAALLLYVFLIWYRDWFGKGPFIYRLLMLPVPRYHLYLAKLSAILVFIFTLLSYQLLLLVLQDGLFRLIVPGELRAPSYFSDVISANRALPVLLPAAPDQFLIAYGMGFVALLIMFTAILLERSYRPFGIVLAIGYLAVCAAALAIPTLKLWTDNYQWLYTGEMLALVGAVWIATAALSLWLGIRLLAKKVSV